MPSTHYYEEEEPSLSFSNSQACSSYLSSSFSFLPTFSLTFHFMPLSFYSPFAMNHDSHSSTIRIAPFTCTTWTHWRTEKLNFVKNCILVFFPDFQFQSSISFWGLQTTSFCKHVDSFVTFSVFVLAIFYITERASIKWWFDWRATSLWLYLLLSQHLYMK